MRRALSSATLRGRSAADWPSPSPWSAGAASERFFRVEVGVHGASARAGPRGQACSTSFLVVFTGYLAPRR